MPRIDLSATDSPNEADEPEATARPAPSPPRPEVAPEKPQPVPRGQVAGKEKLQPYITTAVAEAARNAVVATTPHEGGYQSLSDLIEDAIREKVDRLERRFNGGQPFPKRPRKLKTGRPTKR